MHTSGLTPPRCHINYHPTAEPVRTYFIYTEGNDPPYDVAFKTYVSPDASPSRSANLGGSFPDPRNSYQDGFRTYGERPYQSHDHGKDCLPYRFQNLNPGMRYDLEFIDYTRKGEARPSILIDGKLPKELFADSTIVVEIKRNSGFCSSTNMSP